jgi:hypothetical protein
MELAKADSHGEIARIRRCINALMSRVRLLSIGWVRRSASGKSSVYDTIQARNPTWTRSKARRALARVEKEDLVGICNETVAGGTKPAPCAEAGLMKDILNRIKALLDDPDAGTKEIETPAGGPPSDHRLFCKCPACT